MKRFVRWLIFWYAAITGHDEYAAGYGSLKFRFFNWLYEGDGETYINFTPRDICESCYLYPAFQETDDMVKLCLKCWIEARNLTEVEK